MRFGIQTSTGGIKHIESLLERGAREDVNHPRGVTLKKGTLQVSSIYIWFQQDFGGTPEGVLDHLRRSAEYPLADTLKLYRGSLEHGYDGASIALSHGSGPKSGSPKLVTCWDEILVFGTLKVQR